MTQFDFRTYFIGDKIRRKSSDLFVTYAVGSQTILLKLYHDLDKYWNLSTISEQIMRSTVDMCKPFALLHLGRLIPVAAVIHLL